jgi:hypothetical protein
MQAHRGAFWKIFLDVDKKRAQGPSYAGLVAKACPHELLEDSDSAEEVEEVEGEGGHSDSSHACHDSSPTGVGSLARVEGGASEHSTAGDGGEGGLTDATTPPSTRGEGVQGEEEEGADSTSFHTPFFSSQKSGSSFIASSASAADSTPGDDTPRSAASSSGNSSSGNSSSADSQAAWDEAACLVQIEKDLHRTFPTHPSMDHQGRAKLRRILAAYARHNTQVGYCQVRVCACESTHRHT